MGLHEESTFGLEVEVGVTEPLKRGFFCDLRGRISKGHGLISHMKKIAYFCLDCERLMHANGRCEPSVGYSAQWAFIIIRHSEVDIINLKFLLMRFDAISGLKINFTRVKQ